MSALKLYSMESSPIGGRRMFLVEKGVNVPFVPVTSEKESNARTGTPPSPSTRAASWQPWFWRMARALGSPCYHGYLEELCRSGIYSLDRKTARWSRCGIAQGAEGFAAVMEAVRNTVQV